MSKITVNVYHPVYDFIQNNCVLYETICPVVFPNIHVLFSYHPLPEGARENTHYRLSTISIYLNNTRFEILTCCFIFIWEIFIIFGNIVLFHSVEFEITE